MNNTLRETVQHDNESLCVRFEAPMRELAKRAVRVWFNRQRLDRVLSEAGEMRQASDLLYAIDTNGRQLSSNFYKDRIDFSAYGQDLSQRPYAVTTTVLNNAAFQGAFLCDAYISQVTQRPCITLMCGVTSGPTTLGFVAADLELHS